MKKSSSKSPRANNVPRAVHLDILRLIAIFLVLFNHTWTRGFSLWTISHNSGVLYWLYMFLSITDKIGVPLFLMISGALLLKCFYRGNSYRGGYSFLVCFKSKRALRHRR